jgi:hypothetical protein
MDVPENPQRDTARRVSDAVREVITTAGGSTCPEVVNRTVCQTFVDTDIYRCSMLATIDVKIAQLKPQAIAATDIGYCDEITTPTDEFFSELLC